MDPKNKYTVMQNAQYDVDAAEWSPDNRDPVVGSFDKHNNWADYDNFLFKGIDTTQKIALDFGCGPGRNDAKKTNSHYDTRVDDPNELKSDLNKIGFVDFDYDLRPTGPGDSHGSWIFFRARKP